MNNITIHKNKGEIFKCQFKIDGAEIKDTVVRLCLEFDNNKNMFFYGNLSENGECIIEIPELRELKEKEGKLTVEAIADSVYFKLYEANAEFKNSVEVSMAKMPVTQESVPKMEVKLEGLTQEIAKPRRSKERPKEPIEENKTVTETKNDDWTPLKKDVTEDGKLNSFQNYLKKKQTTSEV